MYMNRLHDILLTVIESNAYEIKSKIDEYFDKVSDPIDHIKENSAKISTVRNPIAELFEVLESYAEDLEEIFEDKIQRKQTEPDWTLKPRHLSVFSNLVSNIRTEILDFNEFIEQLIKNLSPRQLESPKCEDKEITGLEERIVDDVRELCVSFARLSKNITILNERMFNLLRGVESFLEKGDAK